MNTVLKLKSEILFYTFLTLSMFWLSSGVAFAANTSPLMQYDLISFLGKSYEVLQSMASLIWSMFALLAAICIYNTALSLYQLSDETKRVPAMRPVHWAIGGIVFLTINSIMVRVGNQLEIPGLSKYGLKGKILDEGAFGLVEADTKIFLAKAAIILFFNIVGTIFIIQAISTYTDSFTKEDSRGDRRGKVKTILFYLVGGVLLLSTNTFAEWTFNLFKTHYIG